MSDHKSEVSPTGLEADSTGASFSTNGTDPAGNAYGYDETEGVGEGRHFLDELAKAMQSTAAAEQARNAEGTEQRRQSHIDAIRAREAIEAEELRELAKEDVKSIDGWSDGEIKRIKLERERRIAARREQLQVRLEEHRTVVGHEVESVEAAVGAYRADIEQYFRRLESETDPVVIAQLAGSRPPFPDLELIGPDPVGVAVAPASHNGAIEMPAAVAYDPAPMPSEAVASIQETPQAEAPADEMPTAAVAEETPVDTHSDASGDTTVAHDDTPLIGVMEAEADAEPTRTEWAAESGGAVAAESFDGAEPIVASSDTPTEAGEGTEGEPVGAGAESVVVMPRSTSAGSWLRWPNNSGGDGGQ
ncbi:MAG: hypothetical protein ABJC39_08965 [Chloroflexota bacterium]